MLPVKKMIIGLGVAGALLMGFPDAGRAEYYRFINQDGVVSYTDDPTEIPLESWDNTTAFKTISTPRPLTPAEGDAVEEEAQAPGKAGEAAEGKQAAKGKEGAKGKEEAKTEEKTPEKKDPAKDSFLARKKELETKREQARLGYVRASKEGDDIQAEMFMKQFKEFNDQVSGLRTEVMNAYGGEMPEWW